MRRRNPLVTCICAVLASTGIAHAQDWDVGPAHSHHHPHGPLIRRPTGTAPVHVGPTVHRPPPPALQPGQVAGADRRDQMIRRLMESVLRSPDESSAAMPALLRLVRERDGSIDALVADLEHRAANGHAPEPYVALGDVYREADRVDDAITAYRRAESLAPDNPVPPRALGELFRRLERLPEARDALARALERTHDPHIETELFRSLMTLSVSLHTVEDARRYHTRLVALDRGASVRRELADALLGAQQWTDATTEYQSVARALAGDNRVLPPVLRDMARAQLGAGQPAAALVTLQRGLALAGSDSGVRRDLYDAMADAHDQLHDTETWVAALEREGGATFERSMLLARLHDQLGQADAALASLRRAIGQRPGDINARLQFVEALTRLGRVDELIAARRQLVAQAPGNPEYVRALSELLVQNGHRDEALRDLAVSSARAGGDADAHSELAAVYTRMGMDSLATREHELAARLDPDNPDTVGTLAERYLETGQRDRALATARRMVDSAHDRGRGLTRLAEWYAAHDLVPMAMDTYREALRLRPDSLDDHKGLAVLLEQSRAFDLAIAEWRRVIELAGRDRDLQREARTRLVNLWAVAGRLDAQVAMLEGALGGTPPDVNAGRDLAEAYARLHRPVDALRVLRRVSELDPGDATTLTALERLLTQQGDLNGAIAVLQRLVRADPAHGRDWYQRLSQHALALRRDDEAVDYAAHAVQLNPDDAQGHLRLAELYRTRNDTQNAIASFRRALDLNDRLFVTYFELADVYLQRDDPRAAAELYRRVIRLAQDDDLVARAGRMAIQVAAAGDVLADLERDLSTAAAAAPGRTVLQRLLVDLYVSVCRPLIQSVRHGGPAEAARARVELLRLGARALAPLLDALASSDAVRQRMALEILGYLGNPNATNALLTLAEDQTVDLAVRRQASRAAATLGDPHALPRLTTLATAMDPQVAAFAVWGIARIRTPAAVAVLRSTLADSQPTPLRIVAALGLAGSHDAVSRGALVALVDRSEPNTSEILQAAALWALGSGSDLAARARLRAALSGSEVMRVAAVAACGAGPQALCPVDDVAAALFSSVSPRLRRVAARALVQLSGARQVRTDVGPDEPLTGDAGEALFWSLIDPPIDVTDGGDALVRFAPEVTRAAVAAASLRDGLGVVLEARSEPSGCAPLVHGRTPRADVETVLREMDRALAPAMVRAVASHDALIRARALALLARTGTDAAGAAIAAALADPDDGVRERAVTALERFHGALPATTFAALQARLLSADVPWTGRLKAAEVLAWLGNVAGVQGLSAALASDSYAHVRAAAAHSLGTLLAAQENTAVRSALYAAAVHDVDDGVRAAARDALAIRPIAAGRAAGP